MTELTITHADGSTETIAQTVGWTRKQELGAMRRVTIDVERERANSVTLEPKSDTIDLGTIDTLRLVDVDTGGSTWRLVCYSFEWDANAAGFTAGGDLREGTDDALVSGLVSEVPSWTAGTINSFTGPLSFVFSHAHRHEAIRRIERNVPGEIRFRDEGTVDYVDSLGSDKSGSVTLSADAGTLEKDIQITDRGRELDGTHIRVLGAHEGEAQLFANLVPDGDPATYENEVRYTTPRWSDSSDTDWDRWENKDVTDQATIEEEAAALADEITDPLVEAKATVSGVDIDVGDIVKVEKPDADLDRNMRIHRLKEIADGAKRIYEVLLSTRTTVRKGDSDDLEDIQRFNTGFQGSSVSVQGGGSRQPVDSGVNAEIPFDYPQLEFENEAVLQVRGLPYRAYSSGAAAGGDHTHNVDINTTSANNPDYQNVVDVETSTLGINWSGGPLSDFTVDTFTPLENGSFTLIFTIMRVTSLDVTETNFRVWVRDTETSKTYPGTSGLTNYNVSEGGAISLSTVIAQDTNGHDLEVHVEEVGNNSTGGSIDAAMAWQVAGLHDHVVSAFETSDASGDHTHPADPGVIEFGSTTPSGVDVIVNGSTVATDIGNGTFETEVDITGELTPGAWNLIELTSDTLGHIQGTVSLDGYKQIGKQ